MTRPWRIATRRSALAQAQAGHVADALAAATGREAELVPMSTTGDDQPDRAIQAFDAIPFSGLIFFFGLSALSRNPGLSRFLRFNLQQAILLDIAFIIPGFVGSAGQSFPLILQETGCNTIFYMMILAIGYSWYSIAQGKAPDQIPIVSDAAQQSIGPM